MTWPPIAVDSRKFNGHDFIDVHVGEHLLTQPESSTWLSWIYGKYQGLNHLSTSFQPFFCRFNSRFCNLHPWLDPYGFVTNRNIINYIIYTHHIRIIISYCKHWINLYFGDPSPRIPIKYVYVWGFPSKPPAAFSHDVNHRYDVYRTVNFPNGT